MKAKKRKRKLTLEFVKKEVKRLDPSAWDENDETSMLAVVLVSTLVLGSHNIDKLKKFTGYKDAFIRKTYRDAVRSGIWTKRAVRYGEWDSKEHGGVAFWLDVLTVQGFIGRVHE